MTAILFVRSLGSVTDVRNEVGINHQPFARDVENAYVSRRRIDDGQLDTASARAIELIGFLKKDPDNPVKVVDVSHLVGRLYAWRRDVRQTPCLWADGRRYQGIDEISRFIKEQNVEHMA